MSHPSPGVFPFCIPQTLEAGLKGLEVASYGRHIRCDLTIQPIPAENRANLGQIILHLVLEPFHAVLDLGALGPGLHQFSGQVHKPGNALRGHFGVKTHLPCQVRDLFLQGYDGIPGFSVPPGESRSRGPAPAVTGPAQCRPPATSGAPATGPGSQAPGGGRSCSKGPLARLLALDAHPRSCQVTSPRQ